MNNSLLVFTVINVHCIVYIMFITHIYGILIIILVIDCRHLYKKLISFDCKDFDKDYS